MQTTAGEQSWVDLSSSTQGESGIATEEQILASLSEDDQKWYVIQMGWRQVEQFCEAIGLPQYSELMLSRGITSEKKIREITQFVIQGDFLLTDHDEIEAILDAVAALKFRPEDAQFADLVNRFGDPDSLMRECAQGRQWLESHQSWQKPRPIWRDPDYPHIAHSYEAKWGVPPEDHAKFSTEGLWACAGGCDGMLFLWPFDPDDDTWQPGVVRCGMVHAAVCTDFIIDWETMRTMSCGLDCRVVLHNFETNRNVGKVNNNSGVDIQNAFLCLDGDFDLGRVAVGTAGGRIKMGDVETGKIVSHLKGHTDDVYSVKCDWNRNQCVSGAWDRNVCVWDIRCARRTKTLVGHEIVFNKMDVDFERQLALSTALEPTFILWDLRYGDAIKKYQGDPRGNNSVCVNWDRMIAAVGGDGNDVQIWDLEHGEVIKTIECNHQQSLTIDVNWDLGFLLTGSWDNKVGVYDLETGEQVKEYLKQRRTLTQVHVSGGRGRP